MVAWANFHANFDWSSYGPRGALKDRFLCCRRLRGRKWLAPSHYSKLWIIYREQGLEAMTETEERRGQLGTLLGGVLVYALILWIGLQAVIWGGSLLIAPLRIAFQGLY